MSKLGYKRVKVDLPYADWLDLQQFKGKSDEHRIVMLIRLASKSLKRAEDQARANVAVAEAEYDRQRLPWWRRVFTRKAGAAQSTKAP